jgi:hypothetical protein
LDFWGNLDFTTLISMRNERITRLESWITMNRDSDYKDVNKIRLHSAEGAGGGGYFLFDTLILNYLMNHLMNHLLTSWTAE